jgi:hypothetical protein
MARPAATDDTVTRRRAEVATLYCQGWPQWRIGDKFGVTQMTISNDLKAIRKEWQRVMVEEFDALKAEQLAKIDATEAEAWRGWRRSLKPAEKKTAKVVNESGTVKQETAKTEEGQTGNPHFLSVILKCVERRCKLIGADAPAKIDLTIEQMRSMSNEQLRSIAEGKPLLTGYAGAPSVN